MKRTKALLLGLALILALSCLSSPALAYKQIADLDSKCTLTINSAYADVTYEVYRVCAIDKNVRFTPVAPFDVKPISDTIINQIAKESNQAWKDLIPSLASWLAGQGGTVKATDSTVSGPDNKAVFTDLEPGLYLVRGVERQVDGKYYTPLDFLVTLPGWVRNDETGDDEWIYDVEVTGKGEERPINNPSYTSLKVLKVWEDNGNEELPTEVTVQLLYRKRGTNDPFVVKETVTLTRENDSYIWSNLDDDYEWIIQEINVPEGYVSSTSQNGVNFVITNEYIPEFEEFPDDPPPLDEFPNLPDIDIPDEDPPLVGPPDLTDIEDEDVPLASLPQTGMLWWPVPILAVSGMFLFILGWGLHRRQQNDEE